MERVEIPEHLRVAVLHLQFMAVERFRGELAAKMNALACEGDNTFSGYMGDEPGTWRAAADMALTMPFDEEP